MAGPTADFGDFDLEDMQETGQAEFRLEDVAERVYNQVHRGNQGSWGGGNASLHDSLEGNAGLQVQYNIMGEFQNQFAGTVEGITGDFYNTLRKIEVKDDYLQSTQKELTSIVGNIEEASRLLERPSNKKIRTLGDLSNRFNQVKKSRQAAASQLEVGSIDTGPTISYVDPLTGRTVSRNQYQSSDPTDYLGTPSTEAFNESKAYFKNKVANDGIARANEHFSRLQTYMETAEMSVIGTDQNSGESVYGYNLSDFDGILSGQGSHYLQGGYGYDQITAEQMNDIMSNGAQGLYSQGQHEAFNALIGFSVLREDNNYHESLNTPWLYGLEESQQEQIYNELANLTSGLYGGLYGSAFDSMAGSLSAANLGFGTAQEAFKASTEQKYIAGEKQKALRQSISKLGTVFNKNKQRLLPNQKEPLTRFSGFKGGRPQ
mgnify:CR=1 FL=1|tara:strand:- start:34709 stop:36004 length:1296 start_codon:yes stop_codon:yes gene_type:complete